MSNTTLANQLRLTLEKFAKAANSGGHSSPIVLNCWRKALFDSIEEPDPRFFEAIALINQAVERLYSQVEGSPNLDDYSRKVGTSTLEGFRSLLKPELFHRAVHDLKQNYSDDRINLLGILSSALRAERSENEIPTEELDGLAKELDEIVESISKTELDAELKSTLKLHASFLAWAVRNAAIVGAQGIYEAMMRILATTRKIPPEEMKKKNSWGDRLNKALGRTMAAAKFAESADEHAHKFMQLAHDGQHFIQTLLPK